MMYEMSLELQPGENRVAIYGKWYVVLRQVDVSLRPGEPLWFWRFGHEDTGDLAASFHKNRKTAEADAYRAAHSFWPSLAAEWI